MKSSKIVLASNLGIPCDDDFAVLWNPDTVAFADLSVTDEYAFDGPGFEFSFVRILVENERLAS